MASTETIAEKLARERKALAETASFIDAHIAELEANWDRDRIPAWLGYLAGRASGLREAERVFDRLQREEEAKQ